MCFKEEKRLFIKEKDLYVSMVFESSRIKVEYSISFNHIINSNLLLDGSVYDINKLVDLRILFGRTYHLGFATLCASFQYNGG